MNTVKKSTYKLINKVKDSKFDVDKLHNYCLCLQVGIRDFQLCIVDTDTNACLLLEDYILNDVKTINTRLQVLAGLFENHILLMAGFWKEIKLSVRSHKFSLVPATHFVPESVGEYLKLNCVVNDKVEGEYFYQHKSANVVNAFAADRRLISWIKSLYPTKNIRVFQQGSALIEGILRYDQLTKVKTVYCILDRGVLHIFVSENQKLHYYNQFSINNSQEYLKYLMLVFKEFGLSQSSQNVIIWGTMSENSETYGLLKKYVKNIHWGQRPSYLKMSYEFDEIPNHQYFDLFSVYLCD